MDGFELAGMALDVLTADSMDQTALTAAATALRHLQHVVAVGHHEPPRTVVVAADHCQGSIDRFFIVFGDREAVESSSVTQQLSDVATLVRTRLGLGAVKHARKSNSKGTMSTKIEGAVPDAIVVAWLSADLLKSGLVKSVEDSREQVMADLGAKAAADVNHLRWLFDQLLPEQRPRFGERLTKLIDTVANVDTWIRERTNNAGMLSVFSHTRRDTDWIASLAGVATTTQRGNPTLAKGEADEAREEQKALDLAVKRVTALLNGSSAKQINALSTFEAIAEKSDPEASPPSMGIVRNILIPLVGNLFGKYAHAAMELLKVAHNTAELLANVIVDSSQSAMGAALDDAVSSMDESKRLRAMYYFVEGLKNTAARANTDAISKISSMAAAGLLSAQELKQVALPEGSVAASDVLFNGAALAWAMYLATRSAPTLMSGGLDKDGNAERYLPRDKVPDGVCTVTVTIDAQSGDATVAAFAVTGLNSQLADAIVRGADRKLAGVNLPKELLVYATGRASGKGAVFVLEAHNRLREVNNWEPLAPELASTKYGALEPAALVAKLLTTLEVPA